jgi:hypothetical protein
VRSICLVILALLVGLVALAPPALAAQGQAVLTGTVNNASRDEPLEGVTVTVTSPALQGKKSVKTDGSGTYRVPNLPIGTYRVRFALDGFKPYARTDVALGADQTIRLNATLQPNELDESEVFVDAPTVDVGSATTGRTVDKDFTEHVPVVSPGARGSRSRSFESLAETAPGAKADDFGTSMNGTTSPENQFVIDGVSVNDPAYGILGTPLSIEFIQEVRVISGGYMPEFGRATGGIYDVVTQNGSNEFHGSVFTYVTPGVFEGPRERERTNGQTISLDTELININDFGFDLGGPIVKDKLWFYAGFDAAFSRYRITRRLNRIRVDPATLDQQFDGDGFALVDPIPGTERSYNATARTYQYIGKLTWAVSENHLLSATVYGAPTLSGGDGDFGIEPQSDEPENHVLDMIGDTNSTRHRYLSLSNDLALKYSGAFDDHDWLLDISFGWHHQDSGNLPSDGSQLGDREGLAGISRVVYGRSVDAEGNPFPHPITDFEGLPDPTVCDAPAGSPLTTLCPTISYQYGGPDYIDESALNRYQFKTVVTRYQEGLGHHVIKAGVDLEVMTYEHDKAYSGGRRYEESDDGTYFIDGRQFGFLEGPDQPIYNNPQRASSVSTTIGGFVQDSWAIMDVVTLNAGVRVDGQYLFGDDGKLGMALANEWSPRIGAIWDPTQQGKSKIFANYAIYYESIPLNIVDRLLPGEREILSLHDAATCDPRSVEQQQGACQEDGNRFPINSGADPNQAWFITSGDRTPIDPDLAPQSSSEFVAGVEYEVIPKGIVGVSYTRRWMNNVVEDMSRDEGQTYFIGNPGEGIASDFPEAVRDYDAMDIYFEKKFDGNDLVHWLAVGSYTLSYLRGNWAGLYRPETLQLDPNLNTDFDIISLLPNRDGPLPGDRTHQVKVYGAVEFTPGKVFAGDLGIAFRTSSGEPTSYLGAHELYGDREVYVLPRGAGERLPWVHRFDLHVGLGAILAKDSKLVFTMDVFNILGLQEIAGTDQNYTFSSVLPVIDGKPSDVCAPNSGCTQTAARHPDGSPLSAAEVNPNFGQPTSYQAPRQFRFGVRATF